jgi:selenocysteine lyase/cysteine desulfurase
LLKFSPAELELIHSSGEENVAGIAALGTALVLLQRAGLDLIQEEEQALTGQALRGLAQIAGVKVYGIKDPGSPRFGQKGGVIIFSLKGVAPNRVAKELAEQGGIGVRSGCHCAHLLVKHLLHIPPALQQLQGLVLTLFPQLALPGVVRISLGIENRPEDVDRLIAVLDKIARQSQAKVGRSSSSKNTGTSGLPQAEMDDFIRAADQRVYTRLI